MLESFGPEHDAMPRLSLHSALGTALLLTSPLAMALGFGPTRNLTTLGQLLYPPQSTTIDPSPSIALPKCGASKSKSVVACTP